MDRDETKKILGVITATYPNWKPENPELTLSVWANMFSEYEYKTVGEALKRYIKTDKVGFAPVPGQIIEQLSFIASAELPEESEAWALVYKAICKSIYNSKEEFDKLPPVIQKAVGCHEQLRNWAMDSDFNAGVESSNFKRTYEIVKQRAIAEAKIGSALSTKLKSLYGLEREEGGRPLEEGASSKSLQADSKRCG